MSGSGGSHFRVADVADGGSDILANLRSFLKIMNRTMALVSCVGVVDVHYDSIVENTVTSYDLTLLPDISYP